jgi:8-oxo-dGTP pyrophosphatase MutT (NUDIX family)
MLREFAFDGGPGLPGLAGSAPGPGARSAAGVSAGPVADPRPAATTVLLRDRSVGPEVFLMRRTPSMAFAPSRYVFPGGGVDRRDRLGDVPWAGPSPQTWADRLGVPPPDATGLVCAAVRETFEECGVLLAGAGPGEVVTDLSDPSWEVDRAGLVSRDLALADLLRRRGLRLRSDLLTAWSRWCTPVFEPRRYDTWFFLAGLPPGQRARELGGEADHVAWLPATEAAAGARDGTLAMMPPTLVTVQEVAAAPDVAALLAAPRELRMVMPWLARSPSGLSVRVDLDGRGGGEPGPPSGVEQVP